MKLLLLINIIFTLSVFSQVNREWVRRYNGTANSFDIASKLLIDHQGNIIVTGAGSFTGSLTDIIAVKYDQSGSQLWLARFNGPGNSADNSYGSCLDNAGNCYIAGFSTDTAFVNRPVTIKTDPGGNIIWSKVLNQPGHSQGLGRTVITNNTEVFITGNARASNGFNDIVTMKYSASSGELLAVAFYNGPSNLDDDGYSLCIDEAGNILVLGNTRLTGNDDIILLKYNSSLQLISQSIFSGTAAGDDKAVEIIYSAGSLYVSGSLYNASSGYDYWIAKLNTAGSIIWQRNFNGTGNHQDLVYDMHVSTDAVYVTGSSRNADTLGSEDIATLKLDTAGQIVWNRLYNGTVGGIDYGVSVAADALGNVYTGGATDEHENHLKYALLKYSSDGNLDWLQTYSSQFLSEDFVSTVAVDNNYNVFVTGISFDSTSDYDIATIKYSQPIGITKILNEVPRDIHLSQNYPNPFNPVTKIKFDVPATGNVKMIVYDLLGNEVVTLVNESLQAGYYEADWNASSYASGVYFYRLIVELPSGDFYTQCRKMIFAR